jgi:hypothetical protein
MFDPVHVTNCQGGVKAVVFTPEYEIRPVGTILHGATVQYAEPGDIVLSSNGVVRRVTEDGKLELTQGKDFNIFPWVVDWFEAPGLQLPAGKGWDGKSTIASRRREKKIRDLFPGLKSSALDKILEYAEVTPRDMMVMSWKLAIPIVNDQRPQGTDNLSWGYIDLDGVSQWVGSFQGIPLDAQQGIFYASMVKTEARRGSFKRLTLKLFKR